MKAILHKMLDGGVGIYPPNPEVLALMTGSGYGWDAGKIAQEKANMMVPVSQIASDAGKVTYTEAMATEWINAIARGGLTEEQAIDLFTRRIRERNGYLDSAVVEEEVLPYHIRGNSEHGHPSIGCCSDPTCNNRYFRDAVVWDDAEPSKCRCDMPKARAVHLEEIRKVRNAELVKEDVTFMRAVEAEDTDAQATIKAKKQTLRDIPATFDITTDVDTPEKLKAKWPTELPARE